MSARAKGEGTISGPLAGVRVADFTWAMVGPYATQFLARMGADVIKIESRRHVDMARTFRLMPGAPAESLEHSTQFHDLNTNKKSITLDLSTPGGVALARDIVAISDIVIDNFSPGVMEKLGLGYKDIRKVKPDIVTISASAWGATGPERHFVGIAQIFAALGGLGYVTGYPDLDPAEFHTGGDARGGLPIAFAALVALIHLKNTGEGQEVDYSIGETFACLMGDILLDYVANGRSQSRRANRDDVMAPHNVYHCQGEDAWVSIAVGTDHEWQALCEAMGRPDLAGDSRFASAPGRRHNQDHLDRAITEWTSQHTPYEIMQRLQQVGVAAVPSFTSRDLCTDPHLHSRDVFVRVPHPLVGSRIVLNVPWKFSRTLVEVFTGAPLLGQHDDWVLGNLLGLSSTQVRRLQAERVLA